MCEGVVGTRLKPSTAKHLRADTGQDLDLEDEAGYDPEDFLGFDLPDETPISVLTPSARVSDTLNGGDVVTTEGVSNQATNLSDTAIGSMPVVDVAMGASVLAEQDVFAEPATKRQKMTVSKIRHFQYPHVDDVEISMGIDFDFDVFPEEPTVESDNAYDFEYQKGGDYDHAESPLQEESSKSEDDERLWWPLNPEEPVLDPVLLSELDAIADQLEVTRLQDMDVFGRRTRHFIWCGTWW